MSKTREVEGIYWWQDNEGLWNLSYDKDNIEEVRSEITGDVIGYREKKSGGEQDE